MKHKKIINLFDLGNSGIIMYVIIFFLTPLWVLVGGPFTLQALNYQLNATALIYLLIGLVAFVAGYQSRIPQKLIARLPKMMGGEWNNAVWVVGIVMAIDVVVKTIKVVGGGYVHIGRDLAFINSPLYSTIGFFEGAGNVALVIAYIVYFSLLQKGDTRASLWKRIAWGIFMIQVVYAIPTCTRTLIVIPPVVYLLVRSYFIPMGVGRLIVAGFMIAAVVFPLGSICRNPVSLFGYFMGEANNMSEAIVSTETVKRFGNFAVDSVLGRINQSVIFTKIVESKEPLLYGSSFKDFFISLGPPRFIWRDKPMVGGDGNALGHRLGVVSENDRATSIGPTIVGDWYMNFGIAGMIGGMAIMGLIWRGIWYYCIPYSSSRSGIMVYGILWVQLIKGLEHSIAPLYAGMVKSFVVLLILHILLVKPAPFFSLRKAPMRNSLQEQHI